MTSPSISLYPPSAAAYCGMLCGGGGPIGKAATLVGAGDVTEHQIPPIPGKCCFFGWSALWFLKHNKNKASWGWEEGDAVFAPGLGKWERSESM